MGIKIVLTGDNHLNAYSSRMRPFQVEQRRKKLKDNFRKTIDYALENKVDLYINVGNLFDMPNPRNDALLTVAEGLNDLKKAGIKAFFIGGTNDTPKGSGIIPQLIFARQENVSIFYKQDIVENIKLNIKGIEINIAGLTTNSILCRDINPLKTALSNYSGNGVKINILLMHYGLEGYISPKANEPVIPLDFFNDYPFNYIFSGHIQSANNFYHNEKIFVLPGATEKLDFSEKKETGFYYLDIDNNKKPHIEFVPVTCQKREEVCVDFNSFYNKDDPNTFIINQLIKASDSKQMLKLVISGNINRDVYQKIKFHNIWHIGEKLNFYFELSREGFYIHDMERDSIKLNRGRLSQKKEVYRVAAEMKKNAKTDYEKEIIEDSIKLITKRFEEMRDW
ncbi:MAG: metallophosphoesterase [bacterium]|nr:metallophosphoesterase [bacterium]